MPMVFGIASIGIGVAMIGKVAGLPPVVLSLVIFFFASVLILPLTTPEMLADFCLFLQSRSKTTNLSIAHHLIH